MSETNHPHHTYVTSKIYRLKSKIPSAHPLLGWTSQDEWDKLFSLATEIKEDFKTVRYPTVAERQDAWELFFAIRDTLFQAKRDQFEERSLSHRNKLIDKIERADYSEIANAIIITLTLGYVEEAIIEEMKEKGKRLKEIKQETYSLKREMTREHATDVFEKILEVREHHDEFWNHFKEYAAQKKRIKEEKHQAWLERKKEKENRNERTRQNIAENEAKLEDALEQRDAIKERIRENRQKIEDAEEHLEKMERQKDDLEDQISSAWSDSFRDRAEGWLEEKEEHIRSKEAYIERLESWIEQDKDKLQSKEEWIERLRSWIREGKDRLNRFS